MLLLKELPITQKTRYNFYTSTVKRDKRVHKEDADLTLHLTVLDIDFLRANNTYP